MSISHQPTVQVFSFGGTIAMTGVAGVVPSLDASALLETVPGLADRVTLRSETVKSIGSANLTFADLMDLAHRIKTTKIDGTVVVQGTDTMEEAAFALDLMLGANARTVLTGAMRPADRLGADGPANLHAAVLTALAPGLSGRGVMVAMNNELHAARYVTKAHTTSLGAFCSPGRAPAGYVLEDRVQFQGLILRPPCLGIPETAPPSVALYEAGFDDDGRMLDALTDMGYKGVIIAALGGGHLSEAQADRAAALVPHMPVILTSRCAQGTVLKASYGYKGAERDLLARGLIWAGALQPNKARILLGLALAQGMARNDIADLIARTA